MQQVPHRRACQSRLYPLDNTILLYWGYILFLFTGTHMTHWIGCAKHCIRCIFKSVLHLWCNNNHGCQLHFHTAVHYFQYHETIASIFLFFFSNKIAALILTYLQQKRNKTTMLQHIRRRERDRGRKEAYKDITGCACRCVLSTWVLRMKLHWHVVCMAYIAQILGCFIEGTSEHEQQIETIQTCW